jgi:uncharacterized protein YndB with AHSA1/START domain
VATSNITNQTARRVGKLMLTVKSELEVELTRVFDAPRQLVFEAHSKPEHMKRWWGPRGTTMVGCEMDFRPGGRYRFVLRKEKGQEYAFRGEYREIVPPERLVQTFEFEGMPGSVAVETLTFTERDGKTTLTTTSRMDSIEARDAMLQSGMEAGAAETYDRLEELLAVLNK